MTTRLITDREAAEIFGCGTTYFWTRIAPRLEKVTMGRRMSRFTSDSIDRLMSEIRAESAAKAVASK